MPPLDVIWVGVLETCDCCGDEYPMSWISYNGIQFLCAACGCNYSPDEKVQENCLRNETASTTLNPQ